MAEEAGAPAPEEARAQGGAAGDAKPQVTPAEVLAMGKYLGVRLEVRALTPRPPLSRPLRVLPARPLLPSLGPHAWVLPRATRRPARARGRRRGPAWS